MGIYGDFRVEGELHLNGRVDDIVLRLTIPLSSRLLSVRPWNGDRSKGSQVLIERTG